jgi:nitrate reductase delta subunit
MTTTVPEACPGYAILSPLLDYPDDGYIARTGDCGRMLDERHDVVAPLVKPFADTIGKMTTEEVQELYTRTFDINPVCTLEVGWHVYGEDYARGEFLVKMRQMLREHALPESTELPDHLTHALALLARLDGEDADELAARYVLPALKKMLDGMADLDNPYKAVLDAIVKSVTSHHDVELVPTRQRRGDPPGSTIRIPVLGPGSKSGGTGR